MTLPQLAVDWLPGAVRDAPDGLDGAPRLLDALLAAVERQRELLAADVDRVLDDVFIESCADWAVPYIGELLGLPPDATRLEVAYAVALRRRKGTARALEDFVRVVTGWSALALEGRALTIWAQRLSYSGGTRPAAVRLRDLRGEGDSPFAPWLRSATPGKRWSPRAVAALVWPWTLRTYNGTTAKRLSDRRFALHPFGLDAPLYVRPPLRRLASDFDPGADTRAGSATGSVASDHTAAHAPVRATYRVLEDLAAPGELSYGEAWQLGEGHPLATPSDDTLPAPLLRLYVGEKPVPWSAMRFAEVTEGSSPPPPGIAYVDVIRGRVALGDGFEGDVRAVWHRPVVGEIGAVAASTPPDPGARLVIAVDPARAGRDQCVETLADAFALAARIGGGGRPPDEVEIRLETSATIPAGGPYGDAAGITRWRIMAPTLMTPTVSGALRLDLGGADVTLEGLRVDGSLVLGSRLRRVVLEGVTMNPAAGRTITIDSDAWLTQFAARRSILGPIRAELAASPVALTDCIIDARGRALDACATLAARPSSHELTPAAASAAVDRVERFPPALRAIGCTFAGFVAAEAVDAQDTIFLDGVGVGDETDGGLRHCYLGPGTQATPAISRCLTEPPPVFESDAFEAGGYYALALEPDQPLLRAASDGGEVGAYHHARRAASLARLRARIHEFVPLGLRSEVALAPWEER